MTWAIILDWFTNAAWPWLKQNWKIVAACAVALFVGIFLSRACAPKPVVVPPVDVTPVISSIVKIDDAERDAKEAAAIKLDVAIRRANEIRDAGITTLTEEQKAEAAKLVDDGDKLDDYLLQVGKDMRK